MKMLSVDVNTGGTLKLLFTSETPLTVFEVWDHIQHSTAITRENFYITYNGRLAKDTDVLFTGSATVTPRLFGGKGGFGSMLRAIGAQIEKTTNREACRDLSGRRLRDINEEKRLKLWIEKQSKRQDDALERKKRKLERLCSEPKHTFQDKKYDSERSILTERIADAVEEGFKVAAATSSGLKRAAETQPQNVKRKKISLGFGLDLDSDELDSSDDDSKEPQTKKQAVDEECKLDAAISSGLKRTSDTQPESIKRKKVSSDSDSNDYSKEPQTKKIALDEECKMDAAISSGLKRTSDTQPESVKRKKVSPDSDSNDDSNEPQAKKRLVVEECCSLDKESNKNLPEKPSVDNVSDSNDVTSIEKSQLIDHSDESLDSEDSTEDSSDNSVSSESKASSGDEMFTKENIVSNDIITIQKSELIVSNS